MKIIIITGPESVGKTTVAEYLACSNNSLWVPEYARKYVENLKRPYNYNDVNTIAHWQYFKYLSVISSAPKVDYVFFDTYLIITKIWFNEVFKSVPDWIDTAIETSKIDKFLLCAPDIQWLADDVRENRDKREYLFQRYKSEIIRFGFKYNIIEGNGQQRKQCAQNSLK